MPYGWSGRPIPELPFYVLTRIPQWLILDLSFLALSVHHMSNPTISVRLIKCAIESVWMISPFVIIAFLVEYKFGISACAYLLADIELAVAAVDESRLLFYVCPRLLSCSRCIHRHTCFCVVLIFQLLHSYVFLIFDILRFLSCFLFLITDGLLGSGNADNLSWPSFALFDVSVYLRDYARGLDVRRFWEMPARRYSRTI